MDLSDLKRWHWTVIGIGLGLALGAAWSNMEPAQRSRSMSASAFELEVRKNEFKPGIPWVGNIVVYPAINGVNAVHFDIVGRDADGNAIYDPRWMAAEIPFKPTLDKPATNADKETIVTYLRRISAQYPQISVSYAWYAEPMWTYTLFALSGAVIVGGIWPTIINLMIGAGLGPPKKKEPAYDLSRFGKDKTTAEKPAYTPGSASGPSEQDLDDLEKLQANLEKNVAGMTVGGSSASGTATQAGGANQPFAPKTLESKPLDAPVDNRTQEEKDYHGAYYPTVVGSTDRNTPPTSPK